MKLSPDTIAMLITITIIYLIAGIIVHKLEKLNAPTKEQEECDHDWHILTQTIMPKFSIYCPKCKYEKKVTEEEWARMRIDKEYEKRNKK